MMFAYSVNIMSEVDTCLEGNWAEGVVGGACYAGVHSSYNYWVERWSFVKTILVIACN